ncbi:MAG: hypothetical protein PUF72_08745 [Clostridiales bacterium]|nr:hypothetical protein [Clostridiales bacterium]
MKIMEGYELEMLDGEKIIQVKKEGNSTIRLIGESNPDREKNRAAASAAAAVLAAADRRIKTRSDFTV